MRINVIITINPKRNAFINILLEYYQQQYIQNVQGILKNLLNDTLLGIQAFLIPFEIYYPKTLQLLSHPINETYFDTPNYTLPYV